MESKLKKIIYNERTIIYFILFIGISARFFLAYLLRDSFFLRGNRHSSIVSTAYNIIHFGEFSISQGNPTAINEPLYTFIVSIVLLFKGYEWLILALIQTLFCLVQSFFIFKITSLIFNNKNISIASASLVFLYPFYITQSISISDTIIFSSLLSVAIYYSLQASFSENKIIALKSGLLWGLLFLTRFSVIAIFPFILFFIIYYNKFSISSFKRAGIIILLTFIVISPWLIRNYSYTKSLFITTHGAIEAWYGYNKDTRDVLINNISVDILAKKAYDEIPPLKKLRLDSSSQILREVREGKILYKSAFDFAIKNFGETISNMPLKLWKFWSWNKNPISNSLGKRNKLSNYWDNFYTFYYLPLLILFIIGLYFSSRNKKQLILLSIIIGYSILHMVVYGFTRLRVPLDQFLIIYATFGIYYIKNRLGSRN